jgi:transposase
MRVIMGEIHIFVVKRYKELKNQEQLTNREISQRLGVSERSLYRWVEEWREEGLV